MSASFSTAPGLALALLLLLTACSNSAEEPPVGAGGADDGQAAAPEGLPYASSIESLAPGDGAGFNARKPEVVLGPPLGKETKGGSLDVLSLGSGGEIVLGFGERRVEDQSGPDFVVFENAFWPGGDRSQVYAELGEVSVSQDGETWLTFPCQSEGDGSGNFPGCAGWTPTLAFDPLDVVPLDLERTGGDAFDLADVGLDQARFVKIVDLKTLDTGGNTVGFDLDAVGLLGQE
ncbi:MAG TPA: hypothetical protein VIW29_15655 [Polyangiaceae bacterium]